MINKFYDRYNELKFLKDKYENLKKGEFGVLYGRRRMGKSELLRKFLKRVNDKKMYVNVIDSNRKEFMKTISTKIFEFSGKLMQISTKNKQPKYSSPETI